MWRTQQGDRDVTAYYNDMMILWQELDMFEVEVWESPNDSARYKEKVEQSRVFVFLAGLNIDLDEVRGRVLERNLCPLLEKFFQRFVARKLGDM